MSELQQIKLGELHASPFNPRKSFDKESLDELADSIRTSGVLSPLLVRTNESGYEIVSGERRFRAAKLAGLKEVPCIVRAFKNESDVRRAQIIENLQRKDVAPLEEAQGFQDLLREVGDESGANVTVEKIAEEIGKSTRHVRARLQLLGLAAPVKKALSAGKLLAGHAQELVPLKPEQQQKMLERIMQLTDDGAPMSVDEIREEIKYSFREPSKPAPLPQKEVERRKRELAAQKKREAAYKANQAKAESDRKRARIVESRAIALLWPKLKNASAKDREWFIREQIREAVRAEGEIAAAWTVAQGKPLPDGYLNIPGLVAKIAKLPFAEQVALVTLARVIDQLAWAPSAAVFTRLGIDRKKIMAQVIAEGKAAAKTQKSFRAAAAAKVQTSAKPAREGKPKKRAAKKEKK